MLGSPSRGSFRLRSPHLLSKQSGLERVAGDLPSPPGAAAPRGAPEHSARFRGERAIRTRSAAPRARRGTISFRRGVGGSAPSRPPIALAQCGGGVRSPRGVAELTPPTPTRYGGLVGPEPPSPSLPNFGDPLAGFPGALRPPRAGTRGLKGRPPAPPRASPRRARSGGACPAPGVQPSPGRAWPPAPGRELRAAGSRPPPGLCRAPTHRAASRVRVYTPIRPDWCSVLKCLDSV
ncbi:basic proline-rich protein-like isoform X2 [Lontra canadensis]|uniref:basic proline-rich protein-like isoform X2 n=1 Tax=Lontra canadensis TaxID=76717 RepID=UPI0013F39829|nr:basic proline-rich protein-like isoform X2 [Lontra canadensis]